MNAHTFVVLRQRWNANAIRLPVASRIWRRDGQAYLDKVAAIVKLANDAGLVAVLAEFGGSLPDADTAAFWKAWAAFFKDNPMVVFDVFNEPSTARIPGHIDRKRQAAEGEV